MNNAITDILEGVPGQFLKMLVKLWPAVAMLAVIAVVAFIFKRRSVKGKIGEMAVGTISGMMLSDEYKVLNDILLPRSDRPSVPSATTQIDHVIVSPYGLFVIESKNYKGKIYGDEKSRTWTCYLGGKKFPFQNPLHQNYLHVRTLSEWLDVPPEHIHSAIVFCGESKFKTPMPDNVGSIRNAVKYIRNFRDPVFTEMEVQAFARKLQSQILENTREAKKQHIQHLKQIHEAK